METGNVSNQAMAIFLIVLACKFLIPLLATIDPAIPDDNTCVVLTGNPNQVEIPIVEAATNSALAPCA